MPTKQRRPGDVITRREAADLFPGGGVHPDTVTRCLPDGLGACVVEWGGHSRPMLLSRALTLRWLSARNCRRRANGQGCWHCRSVLEDCQVVARHLIQARHSALEILEPCPFDGEELCGHPGGFCEPCEPPEELLLLNLERRHPEPPLSRSTPKKKRARPRGPVAVGRRITPHE